MQVYFSFFEDAKLIREMKLKNNEYIDLPATRSSVASILPTIFFLNGL